MAAPDSAPFVVRHHKPWTRGSKDTRRQWCGKAKFNSANNSMLPGKRSRQGRSVFPRQNRRPVERLGPSTGYKPVPRRRGAESRTVNIRQNKRISYVPRSTLLRIAMDPFEIILLIVRALSKPKEPQLPSLTPQQAAAQQAAMQQRLAAMQRAMAEQQARVQPKKKPATRPAAAKPASTTRPGPVPQPTSRTSVPSTTAIATASAPRRTAAASGLLVPLVLGEILAPPLALRQPER